MFSKKLFVIGFVLTALVQLYVPANMIYNQENILNTGAEFKFKAAPIDPNDPFRGKYITLRFEAVNFTVQNKNEWTINEEVYVQLGKDSTGFAKIKSVSKKKPDNQDYIKANIAFLTNDRTNNLRIQYPFDRFYMEESKAQAAENMYRESIIDSTKIAYALVNVKQGYAVISDVMIDGQSISELVRARQNK